jgi:uncharacterized protein YggE
MVDNGTLKLMTSKIAYILLAFLLCVSGAFGAEIPDYPFVFVVGKADIETPPNISTCSLTLRAREQDPGKAASIIEDRLKSVLATLKANHVTPNDIESFNIEKQVLTDENSDNERAVIKGYDVWRNVKFTVRQLESVPPIEVSLVRSPNITNIGCRFDRTDRAAVEGDLLTKALHSARDEAGKLAEPLGRHVAAAVAVSKVPFEAIGGTFGFGDNSAAMAKIDRMFKKSVGPDDLHGDELLVPSTIHMSVSVNVLFKME